MEKRIYLSPPHMGGNELEYIYEAFESNFIAPLGPQVDAFEKEFSEYVGIKYSLALSSGTAAMHLALKGLNINPGDEVFASNLTFIGSVTPIIFEGAVPVFIDSSPATWNMDPVLLKKELEKCHVYGSLPKAVIPTDLYGQCCDLTQILAICDKYNVPVICDSAEALGAKYFTGFSGHNSLVSDSNSEISYTCNHAGKNAKATIFSFNGNKIITTSGGGMLASDDKEFIEKARFLSQQAKEPLPHYEHTEIGYNYRLSNVSAAIGRGQLRVLNERVKRKNEIFDQYFKSLSFLPGITFMPNASYGKSTRWLTVLLIDPDTFGADREQIRLALEKENIESRPVWKPMHLQPVFEIRNNHYTEKKQYKARVVGGKISEQLFKHGLCLPSGTAMTDYDIKRIINIIIKCRS